MIEILTFCREVVETAWARHCAIALLESLNDRTLADMGLNRFMIDASIRSAIPWPASPLAPRPRYRPSLRGCG